MPLLPAVELGPLPVAEALVLAAGFEPRAPLLAVVPAAVVAAAPELAPPLAPVAVVVEVTPPVAAEGLAPALAVGSVAV